MKFINIIFIFLVLNIYACEKQKVERLLAGSWLVQEILYKEESILISQYMNSPLYFESGYKLVVPKNLSLSYNSNNGEWEVRKKIIDGQTTFSVIIECEDTILRGNYQIYIYHNVAGKYIMELTSASTKIIAEKMCLDGCPELNSTK